jgi:hypothetical protein
MGAAVVAVGKAVVAVAGVELPGQGELSEIVLALDPLGLGLGFAQRRQEHRGKNGNDCDDDQQLDEGESRSLEPRLHRR